MSAREPEISPIFERAKFGDASDGRQRSGNPTIRLRKGAFVMLSVVHIEDDPLWSEFIAKILRDEPRINGVASASCAAAGLQLCRQLQPDAVIVDLILPDSRGFDIVEKLELCPKRPRILLLTVRDDEATLYLVLSRRVDGMVWKGLSVRDHLLATIIAAIEGRSYLPPDVRDALRTLRQDSTAFFKIMTNRELELLPMFATGASDGEIGSMKGISAATVKSHREHVLRKLDIHSSEKLMQWAISRGFAALPASRRKG